MLFDIIERQCADGIAFMAVHCGINRTTVERLEKQGYRYGGLVSKGGASADRSPRHATSGCAPCAASSAPTGPRPICLKRPWQALKT